MRFLPFGAALLSALLIVSGCGGGGGGGGTSGGGGTDHFAKPKVQIAWAARTKAIGAPSSALSAVVTLKKASRTGTDVSFSFDRSGPASGSTVTYAGTEDVKVATADMTIRFYAQTGTAGDVVGTAAGSVQIGNDGTVSTSVETQGTVSQVEVPAGQTVAVGEDRDLEFGCRDSEGHVLAVTPGSAAWSVTAGADRLSFSEGKAHGISAGTATVTATVDSKASSPTAVSVTDPGAITVAVAPTSVALPPSGTQTFTATVEGTENKSVTWSVVEEGGGSVTSAGAYTAPASAGTYTVVATSVANPQKKATATVTVQNIKVTVSPSSPTANMGGKIQFNATVTGTTNQAVTWTIESENGGTIDANGLYTAPNAPGFYDIYATSQAAPWAIGTTRVSVTGGQATFAIIARVQGVESGLQNVVGITCISADGSTLGGRTVGGSWNPPAFWSNPQWVTMGGDLSNPVSGSVRALSANGFHCVGTISNAQTTHTFRWLRGAPGRIKSMSGGTTQPDPDPTGLSADGRKVYGSENGVGILWTAADGTQPYSDLLTINAASDDALIVGGRAPSLAVNGTEAGIWSKDGLIRLGHNRVEQMSADGNVAVINDGSQSYYWTRWGGETLIGECNVLSLSRNGQYVIYENSEGVYLWSPGVGPKPLGDILMAAGAPTGLDLKTFTHFINGDGTVIAGHCKKSAPEGGMGTYVYRAKLPAAP